MYANSVLPVHSLGTPNTCMASLTFFLIHPPLLVLDPVMMMPLFAMMMIKPQERLCLLVVALVLDVQEFEVRQH